MVFQIKNSFNGHFILPNTAFAKDWGSILKINAGELLEDDISRWGRRKDAGECANKFVDELINDGVFALDTFYDNCDGSNEEIISNVEIEE